MQGLAALGAVAFVFVAGCISPPPAVDAPRTPPAPPVYAPPTEICVLRAGTAGGDATYLVRDNGNLVATVGQGYFCFPAPPGAHHVAVEVGARSATIDVTLAAGERVFLQQSSSGEGVALARLSQAAPVSSPSTAPTPGVAAAPDAKPSIQAPPSAPPAAPRPRPDGLVYGVDVGIGLASSRVAPAQVATPTFAGLASVLIGMWPTDSFLLAGRIDISLLNGAGVADVAAHLAIFPGTGRSGSLRNFMFFADGGAAVPIASQSTGLQSGPPIAGVGRIGFGWQVWHVGPTLLGPLFCGQIVRASGEAYAAMLGGLTATLDSQGKPK
jgi:hypothetical protein